MICRRRSWRFRLVVFLVRMWLACDFAYVYLPDPVLLKRLAAERFVFIFGILKIPPKNRWRVKSFRSIARHLCIWLTMCEPWLLEAQTPIAVGADVCDYFGAKTMTKVRPSNFGLCSTTASSAVSSEILSRSSRPRLESVISRPRNITVTLTLSFLVKNFLM